MSTLYVSDLDGTLLRSDEKTSDYTNRVINNLTEKGVFFSYATARSFVTAKKVTKGIIAKIPLIVYNGAFVIDNVTEEILIANYFDNSVYHILEDLFANEIYPIVYAYIQGKEKFSFVPNLCTAGMNKFLSSRNGDIRTNAVNAIEELKEGDIFYITCIDEPKKLRPLYVLFGKLHAAKFLHFKQIKRRYWINYSDAFCGRLFYSVPSCVIMSLFPLNKAAGISPSKARFLLHATSPVFNTALLHTYDNLYYRF